MYTILKLKRFWKDSIYLLEKLTLMIEAQEKKGLIKRCSNWKLNHIFQLVAHISQHYEDI